MAFEDNFKGDTAALLGSIEALLNLAAVNALVPPVPAMPLQLLQSAAARLSTPAEESGSQPPADYQARVHDWMRATFPPEVIEDPLERCFRFLEEAVELVQAAGCTAEEAHRLVDYTFNRDQGEINQEVGGVMVTLAAFCHTLKVDMAQAGETELARVWTKVEKIRAKHNSKPANVRSSLPGVAPAEARAVYPVPAGWRLVPETANDGWWHTLANLRQGRSPTPRCEAPSEYELRMCREIINEVLAAAPAPPKAETGADHG